MGWPGEGMAFSLNAACPPTHDSTPPDTTPEQPALGAVLLRGVHCSRCGTKEKPGVSRGAGERWHR